MRRRSRFQVVPNSKACHTAGCRLTFAAKTARARDQGLNHLSDAPASPTPSAALPPLTAHITCSRGMADWLRANQVSVAFTSYQTGRLYLVGVDDAGGLAIHEVGTGRARDQRSPHF
jgi:hypothetical protein